MKRKWLTIYPTNFIDNQRKLQGNFIVCKQESKNIRFVSRLFHLKPVESLGFNFERRWWVFVL